MTVLKNKIFTILLFILIWLFLIAFSIKKTGVINTVKNITKPVSNFFLTPQDIMLCDFESSNDFWIWRPQGGVITKSSLHVFSGESSAKIDFMNSDTSKVPMPGFILEDYNVGPRGEKDWSRFALFTFNIYNPHTFTVPIQVKLKDRGGRSFYQSFKVQPGKNRSAIHLEQAGASLDLKNMLYIGFLMMQPKQDYTLYLDTVRLRRGELKEKTILSNPKIEFITITAPASVKRGGQMSLSFKIKARERLYRNYRVFIHVSSKGEINKKTVKRRWFINADQDPWVPTSEWQAGGVYEIGPVEIFFPEAFPLGPYVVQVGLYNPDPDARSRMHSASSHSGVFDYRGSYPRLRYSNSEIKEYIVGYIELVE